MYKLFQVSTDRPWNKARKWLSVYTEVKHSIRDLKKRDVLEYRSRVRLTHHSIMPPHKNFLNFDTIGPSRTHKFQQTVSITLKDIDNHSNVKLHIIICIHATLFLNRYSPIKHSHLNFYFFILSKFSIQSNPLLSRPFINCKPIIVLSRLQSQAQLLLELR